MRSDASKCPSYFMRTAQEVMTETENNLKEIANKFGRSLSVSTRFHLSHKNIFTTSIEISCVKIKTLSLKKKTETHKKNMIILDKQAIRRMCKF